MHKAVVFRHDDGQHLMNPSSIPTTSTSKPPWRRRGGFVRRGLAGAAAAVLGVTGVVAAAMPATAVTDPNPEFRLNKADLDFILRQIQISESHAAGNPLLCDNPADTSWTCVPDPKLAYGLRTVDGSYNNLIAGQETYGAAAMPFPRLADPLFRDADPAAPGAPATSYGDINNLVVDPEPRMISNLIVDQTVENPAALQMMATVEGSYTFDHDNDPATPDRVFIPNVSPDVGLSAPFTGWFTLFGQFFDHGPSKGQPVKSACAPAYFIQDDQGAFSGLTQDPGGFAHLDHEGRLAHGQVV